MKALINSRTPNILEEKTANKAARLSKSLRGRGHRWDISGRENENGVADRRACETNTVATGCRPEQVIQVEKCAEHGNTALAQGHASGASDVGSKSVTAGHCQLSISLSFQNR